MKKMEMQKNDATKPLYAYEEKRQRVQQRIMHVGSHSNEINHNKKSS